MKICEKFLVFFLVCLAAVGCLTACNGDPSEGDTTASATETQAVSAAPVVKVDVSLTLQDQDGKLISEAVISIIPVAEDGESATLTPDADGKASVALPVGEYTVRFDLLPEYVLGIETPLTVVEGMEPVVLTVTDNTPNGSEERPFAISEDSVTVTVPAGATYHFTLFGGHNRTLTVEQGNAEIIYRDTVYAPNEEGRIEVRMTTESPRDPSFFALTNRGSEAAEITVIILSDPGAMDNPIVIAALGEAITAQVPVDGMVYYKWIATETGILTVTSNDTINNISLNNLTTSQVSDFTEGKTTETLSVTVGDEVTVVVSVLGGDKSAEYNTVTFTLTMGE